MLTSIADLRRALTVGTVVQVVNHRYPELSGERTVTRAQTKRVCLTLPAAHPRAETVNAHGGSWLDLPKRDEVTFDNNTAQGLANGEPWVEVTVP